MFQGLSSAIEPTVSSRFEKKKNETGIRNSKTPQWGLDETSAPDIHGCPGAGHDVGPDLGPDLSQAQ